MIKPVIKIHVLIFLALTTKFAYADSSGFFDKLQSLFESKGVVILESDIVDGLVQIDGETVAMLDSEKRARFEISSGTHVLSIRKTSQDGLWRYSAEKTIFVGEGSNSVIELLTERKPTPKQIEIEKAKEEKAAEESRKVNERNKINSVVTQQIRELNEATESFVEDTKHLVSLITVSNLLPRAKDCTVILKYPPQYEKKLEDVENNLVSYWETLETRVSESRSSERKAETTELYNRLVTTLEQYRDELLNEEIFVKENSIAISPEVSSPSEWMAKYFYLLDIKRENSETRETQKFFRNFPSFRNFNTAEFANNCLNEVSKYSKDWVLEIGALTDHLERYSYDW